MNRRFYDNELKTRSLPSEYRKYLNSVDSDYGFKIAVKLTEFKTTTDGFRLAGTFAESAAADWIVKEMKRIGLEEVTKESISVDAWDFREASVVVRSSDGMECMMKAASFPCLPGTSNEGIEGDIAYVHDGTKKYYNEEDVRGKIVFIDTDAYHSYWYNSLFLQAEMRGAKAIIAAVTDTGPGTYKDDLLTVQDVMARVEIPAVIISRNDSADLRRALERGENLKAVVNVRIDITPDAEAHYVYGKINGKNPDRYIIIGGHYDAYWDGFLDNASSLGTTLTIAKAMIDSGYEPESTFVFISNGAEEYGLANTKYDFCTGAWTILKGHPEWIESAIIYNNFELSAISQTEKLEILGAPCYERVFGSILKEIGYEDKFEYTLTDGVGADDGVYTKAGIPTYMNMSTHFSDHEDISEQDSGALENYDHTQYDNVERYDAKVFDFNNKIFGLINMAFDSKLIVPCDFTLDMKRYMSVIREVGSENIYPYFADLENLVEKCTKKAEDIFRKILRVNEEFDVLRAKDAEKQKAICVLKRAGKINAALLKINRIIKRRISKFDPFCGIIFGSVQPYRYLRAIGDLIEALGQRDFDDELDELLSIDNNFLIPGFDREVYQEVAIDSFLPSIRDSWGKGENLPFPDLYETVTAIMKKRKSFDYEFTEEIRMLEKTWYEQKKILVETLDEEKNAFDEIMGILNTIDVEVI